MKTALLIQALLWALAGEEPPACPSRDAVTQALAPVLIPARQAPASGELPAGVSVVDRGDVFEVTAGGQVQRYNDPAHDCAERARVAAVFIALALNPPMLTPLPPPPPPPSLPPPVIVNPPPAPPPRTLVSVGLAARMDVPAGGGSDTAQGLAVGGEAVLHLERRRFGAMATAGALASTDSSVDFVMVREQRFPLSLSGTMRWPLGPHLQLAGAAGLSLTPFTLEGQRLAAPLSVTKLDVGPRLGVGVRITRWTVVAVAAVHLEYFPRTYALSVTELGTFGHTAPLQIGFSLGFEVPVHGGD